MANEFGPWTLSAAEQARLEEYERLRTLIAKKGDGLDELLKRDKKDLGNVFIPKMYVNMPGLVCRAAADLILPETPKVTPLGTNAGSQDLQARIDVIAARSGIYSLCWRAMYWTAGLGDGFFVIADVAQTADGKGAQPVISFRRALNAIARNVRPEDPLFARAFLFKSAIGGSDLYSEFSAGKIKHRAFQDKKEVALPQGFTAEIETKETVPLAIHLAALRGDDSDEAFGESDFDGTEDFVFEISNRLRQVGRILDRHADPSLNVPGGILDESGTLDVRNKKVFERGVTGEGAEYMTWQSQLSEAYTEIDRLLKIIALLTETPLALWGLDQSGEAASGRALKFKLLAGLAKARRSGAMLKEALAEAFRLALRREDILNGRAPAEYILDVALSETFIADQIESAQFVQTLRAAKAMSIPSAVVAGQGMSGAALDKEVQEIEAEQQAEAPIGLDAARFGAGTGA